MHKSPLVETLKCESTRSAGLVLLIAALLGGCGNDGNGGTGNGGAGGTPGSSGGSSGQSPSGGAGGASPIVGGAGGAESGAGGIAIGGGGPAGAGGFSGADAGSSGTAGAMPGGAAGAPVMAACSENPVRSAPPPGKESFRSDPVDERFPFSRHWMGVFSDSTEPNATRYISMTSLADLDHDGDLDFATGQRHDVGGGMVWWEYCAPDHWVRHAVGTGHRSAAGGNAADVDGDGWVDLLAGDSWYRNPAPPRAAPWVRSSIGAPAAEELIVGEVTSDDRPDVLYVIRNIDPQFWSPGANPAQPWNDVVLTTDAAKRQQQGGAIADIDGDGRDDIVVGDDWWYRNVNPDGQTWTAVPLLTTSFEVYPLTHVGDLDGDEDTDVVMCTHFGSNPGESRVVWAENADGRGTSWTLHPIATGKSFTHSLVAADFDNDGDLDVFLGQNVGEQWIFENTNGRGTFAEHRIAADSRGHEARVGDVDCDGDLDITSKPWGQANEGGEQSNPPRDHIYLKNELVERGGTPRRMVGRYEVLPATAQRTCR